MASDRTGRHMRRQGIFQRPVKAKAIFNPDGHLLPVGAGDRLWEGSVDACMLLEQRYEGCQRGLDLLVRKVWPKAGLISALAWPVTPEDRVHHWQLPTKVKRPYLPFAITEWNFAYLSIEGSSLRIMFNKPALAVEFLDAFLSISESTVRLLKKAHASR